MANTIRIKRRLAGVGVLSTAPTGLQNAELAYNEQSRKLYYGYGIAVEGSTESAAAIEIAGPGYSEALDIATRQALTTLVSQVSTTLQTNINGVNAEGGNTSGLVTDIINLQGRATALETGTTQLTAMFNAVALSAFQIGDRATALETGTTQLTAMFDAVALSAFQIGDRAIVLEAGTTQLTAMFNAVALSGYELDSRITALEGATPAVNLAELGDISVGAAYEIAEGSVLKYNATLSAWEAGTDDTGAGGASNLAELGDISVGAAYEIADGSVLKYNATLSAWEAGIDATGGGGTNRDADIDSLITGFNTLTGSFATVPVLGPLATVALGASVTLATLTLTATSTFQEDITFTKGASLATLSANGAFFTTIGTNTATGTLSGFTTDGSKLALANFSLDGGTF